jgi:hypothetical protein
MLSANPEDRSQAGPLRTESLSLLWHNGNSIQVFRRLPLPYEMEAVGTADIYRRARKPILTQDQQTSPPKKATATARAKGGAVHVSLASNHLKLWLLPTVVSITPDDAMALSIELQKAAIDARVSEAPPPITVEG